MNDKIIAKCDRTGETEGGYYKGINCDIFVEGPTKGGRFTKKVSSNIDIIIKKK